MSPASGDANISLGAGREFDAVRMLLAEWGDLASGIGDDAATLSSGSEGVASTDVTVVSTDACVEGIHFERHWISPFDVGVRAAAAALSDVAAMGARAQSVLIAFIVPEDWKAALPQVARGIGTVVRNANARIVGGNISRGSEFSITTTVLGRTAAPVRRVGAKVGDAVLLTGTFGGPASAVAALHAGSTPSAWALERFRAPVPRLAEGVWLSQQGAHAMIDVSDGLLSDARHLARASAVDIVLDVGAIPCGPSIPTDVALGSGEEYELLLTMTPADATRVVAEFAREFGTPITVVGQVVDPGGEPTVLLGESRGEKTGHRVELPAGYDHFSS